MANLLFVMVTKLFLNEYEGNDKQWEGKTS